MKKRSLTMLARDYNPLKFKVESSYMSEKLDGIRALWLPFTRGMSFSQIPWANRLRDDRDYVCSGLWTRRGKTIQAPAWFLDRLPRDTPLDGELFLGRNLFQKTMSTVRKLEPVDSEWQHITYKVFDIPSYQMFFTTGDIREGGSAGEPAYEIFFKSVWAQQFPEVMTSKWWLPRRFSENVHYLKTVYAWACPEWVGVVDQVQLPGVRHEAEDVVQTTLTDLTMHGAEGLMLRRGHSLWEPYRSQDLAKVKKLRDSEAVVVGYVLGEGKFSQMVGAFRVDWNGKTFDLSGFTERERSLTQAAERSLWEPGTVTTESISQHFPIGTTVSFHYNDLSDDGVPKFARYWRKHEVL